MARTDASTAAADQLLAMPAVAHAIALKFNSRSFLDTFDVSRFSMNDIFWTAEIREALEANEMWDELDVLNSIIAPGPRDTTEYLHNS